MSARKGQPRLRIIEVPVDADSVLGPVVTYDSHLTTVDFRERGDKAWWRIVFDNLDSIRVSRGEDAPLPYDEEPTKVSQWVSVVIDSPWLMERYDYEKRNYGNAYEFGGNVDEMLHDFDHYVFSFHDQYVEALARGIWFDRVDDWTDGPHPAHPLFGLEKIANVERRSAHGIDYQIWTNPKPMEKLIRDAELCAQPLMEFGAEFDGKVKPSWAVTLRARDGKLTSSLRRSFGGVEQTWNGPVIPEVVVPRIEQWLAEVSQRRKEMGKA